MELKFSIAKKGYDTGEVDLYVEKIEKALNDYRGKETALVKALVNAEDASTKIINDANIEAARIIGDAEFKSQKMADDMRYEIVQEIYGIKKMIESEKKALNAFCSDFDEVVKNYFTGSAFDVTAPLREKINLMDSLIKELTTENNEIFESDEASADNNEIKEQKADSIIDSKVDSKVDSDETKVESEASEGKESENLGGFFS